MPPTHHPNHFLLISKLIHIDAVFRYLISSSHFSDCHQYFSMPFPIIIFLERVHRNLKTCK